MSATQLVWLRNDLRLDDNPALNLAQQQGDIAVVFVASPGQWQQHDDSPAKLGLKAASLKDIGTQLAQKGIDVIRAEVRWGRSSDDSYIHGIRFLNLSDIQHGHLFNCMRDTFTKLDNPGYVDGKSISSVS